MEVAMDEVMDRVVETQLKIYNAICYKGIKCPSVPDDVAKKIHDVILTFRDVVVKFSTS